MIFPVYLAVNGTYVMTPYVVALRELTTTHIALISEITNQIVGIVL